MTRLDGPRRTRLASGSETKVLVMRPRSWGVDPGHRELPEPAATRVAQILGQARNGCGLTPVPGPGTALDSPERIGEFDVVSSRGRRALDPGGPTVSPLFLLRQKAADLGPGELIANASYFLFTKPDWDAPWNAYGDPVGLVLTGGTVDFPPQLPRACLLDGPDGTQVARLGLADTAITLPNGEEVRAHPFGAPARVAPFVAFARFHGAVAGYGPLGVGYDLAYLGRWPLAGAPAGRMPIPRAGCVVRFPDRETALAAARGPLRYALPGSWTEGVQAGPLILRDGLVTDTEDVFATEHMIATEHLPEETQVSPAAWRADWDNTKAARLGAGADAKGRPVLVAVEGGSSGLAGTDAARGATLRDLALLMQEHGAVEAVHLDGGGSTQVYGQAGGTLISSNDVHTALPERRAQYDRPVPNWLRLAL